MPLIHQLVGFDHLFANLLSAVWGEFSSCMDELGPHGNEIQRMFGFSSLRICKAFITSNSFMRSLPLCEPHRAPFPPRASQHLEHLYAAVTDETDSAVYEAMDDLGLRRDRQPFKVMELYCESDSGICELLTLIDVRSIWQHAMLRRLIEPRIPVFKVLSRRFQCR
jgi:hypothetical protein